MFDKSSEEMVSETPEKPAFGKLLLARREARGLSLTTVEERTHIRKSFILAFENGDYEKLPALPYAIGFLRQYATLLELDAEQVVQDYRLAIQPTTDMRQRQVAPEVPCLENAAGGKKRHYLYWWLAIGMLLVVAVWLLCKDMKDCTWFTMREDTTAVASSAMASTGATASQTLTDPAETPPVPTSSVPAQGFNQTPAGNGEMPQTIRLSLSAEGGVLRIESQGSGSVEFEADRRPLQYYDMQPGTVVDWTVRDFAEIRVNIPGGSKIWLGDRELGLPDICTVILGQRPVEGKLGLLVTSTEEDRDATSIP